ncbi:hypothetical protein CRG98_024560 [Punica granatum]|uniref:Uncharacterized protein n=1 Tax=Punica granatum TaxID=22663 RepID=A0A2I0JGE5_PUNGR|nr:hypothetical protein CRG98_024560 [Punica granatum]
MRIIDERFIPLFYYGSAVSLIRSRNFFPSFSSAYITSSLHSTRSWVCPPPPLLGPIGGLLVIPHDLFPLAPAMIRHNDGY